jgi:hypothetical protein
MYFLSQAMLWDEAALKPLGERLMKHTQNDWYVELAYGYCFNIRELPAERSKTLAIALALMKKYPLQPSVHSLMAKIYLWSWQFYHDPKDLKNAISECSIYVEEKPASDPCRAAMQRAIEKLNAELASH